MHLTEVTVLLVVVAVCAGSKEEKKWGYDKDPKGLVKPEEWSKTFEKCKGKAQSPINIDTKKAKGKSKLGPLKVKFTTKDKVTKYFKGKLTNNGHAPTFTLDKEAGNATVTFDKKDYILQKFQFHFGCERKRGEDDTGSEHTIDKKAFPAEVHMIFYNKKYKEFEKAVKEKDGLLVIGTFIERLPYNEYVSFWEEIQYFSPLNALSMLDVDEKLAFDYLSLAKMVPKLESGKAPFYTYKGSLTTPDCFESVRWIVLKEPITMSPYMLSWLRTLQIEGQYRGGWYSYYVKRMCDNFRPVQKLNGRKVEYYEPK